MQQELLVFFAGCASGAVVGGLGVGLHGRGTRKAYEQQVKELMQAVSRADEAAMRATQDNAAGSFSHDMPQEVKNEASMPPTERVSTVEAGVQTAEEPAAEQSAEEESLSEPPAEGTEVGNAPGLPAEAGLPSEPVASKEATGRIGRARSGRHLANLPVIDRGEDRSSEGPAPLSFTPMRRQLEPSVRAAIIDRRIPHFDQSLFPDLEMEKQDAAAGEDHFVQAMRAMEDTLQHELTQAAASAAATTVEAPASASTPPAPVPVPNFEDSSSYIDYLIKDEMERRQEQARLDRGVTHNHLTVFEGTGDLSAARRAARHRARHLSSVAEA